MKTYDEIEEFICDQIIYNSRVKNNNHSNPGLQSISVAILTHSLVELKKKL